MVLGSATPSMEAMYRARRGEYTLFEMKNRSRMQELADVYTVDLREELKSGNRSILSRKLAELMRDRLEKKEQIMLFLNQERVFRIYFLPGVRPCDQVPPLQCLSVRPPGRADAVPLLRIFHPQG